MTARATSLGLVLLAAISGGCGTAANTVWLTPDEGGKRVYGGVRVDLQLIETATTGNTGIWVGGEEVKERKPTRKFLFLALDLPFSALGDTLTLPYTLASECGLFGWRCIYEPTTYPKSLDEPVGGGAPTRSDPQNGNALAQLTGNKIRSWTFSRIEIPVTEPTPKKRIVEPLRFLEAMDAPVAASFYSFSGSRDAPSFPSVIRQFGLTGAEPMRGITILRLDITDVARSECHAPSLPEGVAPVDTKEPSP